MGRERETEYHPFIDLLLTHGVRTDGTKGYDNITQACRDRNVERQTVYSCAKRGVYRLDVMQELAQIFCVPKPAYLGWLTLYADQIWDEALEGSKAS